MTSKNNANQRQSRSVSPKSPRQPKTALSSKPKPTDQHASAKFPRRNDRTDSSAPTNRTGRSASPKSSRRADRSASPKSSKATGRSTSPKSLTRIDRSASPKCYKATGRSASPKSLTRIDKSASPKSSKAAGRSASPKSLTRIGRSASPKSSKATGRSASPKSLTRIGRSASPKSSKATGRSTSPKSLTRIDRSVSPKSSKAAGQSTSPKSLTRIDRSASPKSSKAAGRSSSPKSLTRTDRSVSRKSSKAAGRSASPKSLTRTDRSASPKSPRQSDMTISSKSPKKTIHPDSSKLPGRHGHEPLSKTQRNTRIKSRSDKPGDDKTPKRPLSNTDSSDSDASDDSGKRKRKPRNNCCKAIFGGIYNFFHSEPSEYKTVKMMFGYPFGALLGFGLYSMVIKPMELADETRHLIGGMMMLGMACGYATFVGARCVFLLLVPTFFGKAGRSYIGTFAIAYLISGPMTNMMENAQDVTRSLTCAATLAANHTAAKFELRLKPIGNVLNDMKNEGYMLNKIGKKVNKVFSPVKSEVLSDDNLDVLKAKAERKHVAKKGEEKSEDKYGDLPGKDVEKKYKDKVVQRCTDIYNKGMEQCRQTFDGIYHRCMDELPAVIDKWICPVCRAHWLCELAKLIGKAVGIECDPDQFVEPGFGEAYRDSEKSVEQMDSGMEVGLRYSVVKQTEDIDYTNIETMKSNAMHDFKNGRKVVEFFMLIVKRLLAFTFVLVLLGAYKYYKRFTTDVRFDNMYITPYFRKIDARRRNKGKKILLPMKKIEAGQYIVLTSPKMIKSERKKFGKGTILLAIRALCAWMIFFADHILYTVMDVIRRHSRVDYKQSGFNHINVTVMGTGFMSNIVRLFIQGLDTKHELNQLTTNLECLPQPVEVEKKFYYYVFGVYGVIWILILVDAYALRLRKVVAAFFFRKREKQRVLHLYNMMLKRRKMFLKDTIRKLKKKAKKQELKSKSCVLYALTKTLPCIASILGVFTSAKGRCLVCDDPERKDSIGCQNKECKFKYCPECWSDLKETCYACMPLDEFSSTDTDDASDDDDEDDV